MNHAHSGGRAAALVLLAAGLAVLLAGCVIIEDTPGKKWKGDGIAFDVGFSFGEGNYVGTWEIDLGFATGSTTSYSTSATADDVLITTSPSFEKLITMPSGGKITLKGNFTTASSCSGSTTYLGQTKNWTAKPDAQ